MRCGGEYLRSICWCVWYHRYVLGSNDRGWHETGKSARPEASSSRTARQDAFADALSSRARSADAFPFAPMPNSPGAHDPRDYSGCSV